VHQIFKRWISMLLTFAAVLFVIAAPSVLAQDKAAAERLFIEEVKPLLAAKCLACHGNDEKKIKGKFDMRSRAGLLKGGESGDRALVPGDPQKSPMYVAVTWKDADLQMPPKENDRLTAKQMDALERWIAGGAPWVEKAGSVKIDVGDWSTPDAKGGIRVRTSGGLDEQWTNRRYLPQDLWAFNPVSRPAVPGGAASHPVDAFVDGLLLKNKLKSAPRADKRTLIRRAYFDLTGLPPTPKQIEAFVKDQSPKAWEKLIDQLLASPRYGERMGQHWLDVVRYADTAGFSNDWERPHAWRYRDYVIRSFNADKPFDRFVIEQIAGTELDPKDPMMKVAVGYLRMGPWEQTGMSVAAVTRQLWLDDVTNSVGVTFLGNALRCAKCHDHKFDPIPTQDYYRLQAFFAGTSFSDQKAPLSPDENVSEAKVRNQHTSHQMSEKHLTQKSKLEGDNAFGRIQKKLKASRERALKRYQPVALSVSGAKARNVAILNGGALERPGRQVGAGVLSALTEDGKGGFSDFGKAGRLALAKWIADAKNPLTARVIVNRVWQWHFGRGIVATPNAFGKMGSKPTHPRLLDYLADRFVNQSWSIKKLHRLIMTSNAYQRSSQPADGKVAELDPDNKLLSYVTPRRLSAEEMRDAMLQVTGELSTQMGGPGVFPEINWEVALQPRHIMGGIAPSYRPSLTSKQRNRRTIYVYRYRGLSDPMLEVFNKPNADVSCEKRDTTTVTPQAFELFNGDFTHDRSIALATRIGKVTDDLDQQVGLAFKLAYGRAPSDAERAAATEHVKLMIGHHQKHKPEPQPLPTVVKRQMVAEQTGVLFKWEEKLALDGYQRDLKPWDVDAKTRALAELCLVLLNSSEFLYVY